MKRIAVVEIIRRSTQGATRPFLCRCADGGLYWVKGTAAGNPALCAEWIAGRLGTALGLPIPPLAQIEVPRALIESSRFPEIVDLGFGIRFGSRHIEGAQEYDATLVERTPRQLRLRVLEMEMATTVHHLVDIFSELPDEWLWLDAGKTVRSELTFERICATLAVTLKGTSPFWEGLT